MTARSSIAGPNGWSRKRSLSLSRFGRRLSYVAIGNGPPVVLVHGSLQDRRAWRSVASQLSSHYRLIAYDRAGYGESDDHGCDVTCIRCDADDLLALVSRLGLQRPAVIGSSLGSRVALAGLRSAPAMFGSTLLHEPAVEMPRSQRVLELFDHGEHEEAVATFLDDLGLRSERTQRAVARWAPQLEREIRSLLEEPEDGPASSSLPAIGLLVSQHAHDNIQRSAQRLASSVSSITELSLPGGRHDAMVSRPEEFAEACLSFLAGAPM